MVELLVRASPGNNSLVDLGCGTGELARPLARHFGSVLAVDPEPGMVEVGRARASAEGVENIAWVTEKAEAVELEPYSVDLVTVGSAFHWMDRPRVLELARSGLRPGGVFAVVGGNSPWTGTQPWQRVVVSVLERTLGEERRAGDGVFRSPSDPHEVVIARHGFSDVVQHGFETPHDWTLESILGYLRSTSFASRAVLGDRADEFESTVASELLALDPSGTYSETLPFYALIAHPDGEGS